MSNCTTCGKPMTCETSGSDDEYWSEYCLNPSCDDPQCDHGGPDIDFEPAIRVEKCWVNPAYRNECRWQVTLRISQGMVAHLYETPDSILALKYARETAERTGLIVSIHDRAN
jgi:hypothetical protein